MSYVQPADFTRHMVDAGQKKVHLSAKDALIRSTMAGAILALAAAFAISVTVQTGSALAGAILFPVGFILIYLMGLDLVTGVFTLVPLALMDKRSGVTWRSMFRTWGLVFLGNLMGAVLVALIMAVIFTYGFNAPPGEIGTRLGEIGHSRTLGYAEHGAGGMLTLFLRAVLCNWMVSTGVLAAMMSRSVGGKAIAMWMPIMLFFYMGFEHSVVNMFLFPAGLMLGGDFSVWDYMIWNEIPTILGNIVGGLVFVGLGMYLTYGKRKAAGTAETAVAGGAEQDTTAEEMGAEAAVKSSHEPVRV